MQFDVSAKEYGLLTFSCEVGVSAIRPGEILNLLRVTPFPPNYTILQFLGCRQYSWIEGFGSVEVAHPFNSVAPRLSFALETHSRIGFSRKAAVIFNVWVSWIIAKFPSALQPSTVDLEHGIHQNMLAKGRWASTGVVLHRLEVRFQHNIYESREERSAGCIFPL